MARSGASGDDRVLALSASVVLEVAAPVWEDDEGVDEAVEAAESDHGLREERGSVGRVDPERP